MSFLDDGALQLLDGALLVAAALLQEDALLVLVLDEEVLP